MNNKVSIHTEGTPNPNALKFVLDKNILEAGSYNFQDKLKSTNSPLATRLFNVTSVEEVFLGKNFITISKKSDVQWETIYEKLLDEINKHFDSGEPVVIKTKVEDQKGESEIEKKIHYILDSQVRPAVNSDGGDIIFDSYEDGILKLHLQSWCRSHVKERDSGIERSY